MGAGEQNSQLTTPTGGLESGTSDLLVETKAQWKDDLKRTDLNYDFDTVIGFVRLQVLNFHWLAWKLLTKHFSWKLTKLRNSESNSAHKSCDARKNYWKN